MLPVDFLKRTKKMLSDEYDSFIQSYQQKSFKSLRVNPFKGDSDMLTNATQWNLTQIPWCSNGYYYTPEIQPGKHPFHEAGVYYIQEASAMLPAVLLNVEPEEKVLDLCAAPGGKSSQIAFDMKGKGLLICNEIIPARAKILSENIERLGIRNAIVTNTDSQSLQQRFNSFFDKIMIDAPCSGEGMFRKNPEACNEWSPENIHICAARQSDLLEAAARMLTPGGRMVYSTCTFSPEENEGTIYRFLKKHRDFTVVDANLQIDGLDTGRFDFLNYIENPDNTLKSQIEKCIRIWPHKVWGEGHFAAILEKSKEQSDTQTIKPMPGIQRTELNDYLAFEKDFLNVTMNGTFVKFGEQLYLLPDAAPDLKGIKVLRAGLHLGTFLKNRFEPSHALALALSPGDIKYRTEIDLSTAAQYINGQTFASQGEKGWHVITTNGYALGWGKLSGGVMKNHYPKGLRKNLPSTGF